MIGYSGYRGSQDQVYWFFRISILDRGTIGNVRLFEETPEAICHQPRAEGSAKARTISSCLQVMDFHLRRFVFLSSLRVLFFHTQNSQNSVH